MFPTCEALGFMSTRPTAALSHPARAAATAVHRRLCWGTFLAALSKPTVANLQCVVQVVSLCQTGSREGSWTSPWRHLWFWIFQNAEMSQGISSGRWPSRSATSAFVTRLNLEPAHFRTSGAKSGYFCKLVCSRWKYHITFIAMFFLVWEMIKGGDNGTCWAWHVRRALRYCLWRWLHSNLQHCFEKGGCSWYVFAWDCLGGHGLQACLVTFLSDMFGSANEIF